MLNTFYLILRWNTPAHVAVKKTTRPIAPKTMISITEYNIDWCGRPNFSSPMAPKRHATLYKFIAKFSEINGHFWVNKPGNFMGNIDFLNKFVS